MAQPDRKHSSRYLGGKANRRRILIGLTVATVLAGVGIALTLWLGGASAKSIDPEVAVFANPDNPNCPYGTGFVEAATEPRMETDLQIDLSTETQAQSVGLIVASDERVLRTDGAIVQAHEIASGDSVYMSGGRVGIVQSVKQGEYVPEPLETDGNGNVYRRVVGKSQRFVETMLYLYTENELIKTTPEHPFYVNGVWVEAQNLKTGDEIRIKTGGTVEVDHIEFRNDPQMVYSLLVEGSHNFYVGDEGLLAHNCTPGFDDIDKIIQHYPPTSGKCEQCAREVYRLFDEAGIEAQIGHMETDLRYLVTKDEIELSHRVGNSLANHEFARVGDTIYDSLTGAQGMSWIDYQHLFYEGVFDDGTIRVTYFIP